MENKRRKVHEELEVVKVGYANGVAEGFPFTDKEKQKIIKMNNVFYQVHYNELTNNC